MAPRRTKAAAPAAKPTKLAYRALLPSANRRSPSSNIERGIDSLTLQRRSMAWSTAQDLQQNFAIIGWAVRTHLNFVAAFGFQARTADREFSRRLEQFMAEKSVKERCDKTRTFSLSAMFRLRAAMKVWFGEGMVAKVDDGSLWLVPHWRLGKGNGAPPSVNPMGLVVDAYGAKDAFAIRDYKGPESTTGVSDGTFVHTALIDWRNAIYDGFFTTPDQLRGASPLLPAMAHARDAMDVQEYNLLKTKIAAMVGMVLFRDHTKKGRHDFDYQRAVGEGGEVEDVEVGPLDYELRSGLKLELEKDEKVEFLESRTPSTETMALLKSIFRQILSALDIPYSAFDSDGATYSAMRADWNRYKISSLEERASNAAALDQATEHLIRHGIASGELQLPAGWTFENDVNWEWIPQGTFMLDLSRELDAILKKVAAGLQSRSDAAKELGTGDFFDTIDRLAEEEKYIREAGVTVTLGLPGSPTTADAAPPAKDSPQVVEE